MPHFGPTADGAEGQMNEDDMVSIVAYLLTQGDNPPEIEPSCPAPSFDDVMAKYMDTVEVASR